MINMYISFKTDVMGDPAHAQRDAYFKSQIGKKLAVLYQLEVQNVQILRQEISIETMAVLLQRFKVRIMQLHS